jgi:putative SOS response-associated peptidase YedK
MGDISLPAEAIACIFGTANPPPNLAPSWNVVLTNDVAAVRRHPEAGGRHLDLLKWGLLPYWTKEPPMIALTAKAARTNRFRV